MPTTMLQHQLRAKAGGRPPLNKVSLSARGLVPVQMNGTIRSPLLLPLHLLVRDVVVVAAAREQDNYCGLNGISIGAAAATLARTLA